MANSFYPDNQSTLTAKVISKIVANDQVWAYIHNDVFEKIRVRLPQGNEDKIGKCFVCKSDTTVGEILRASLTSLCTLNQIDKFTWEVYDAEDEFIATISTADQFILKSAFDQPGYEGQTFESMKQLLNFLYTNFTPMGIECKKFFVTFGEKRWDVVVKFREDGLYTRLGISIELIDI